MCKDWAISAAVLPVISKITQLQLSMETTQAATAALSDQLVGLDAVQVKVAMSQIGLSKEQQAAVINMLKAASVAEKYTIAELEKAAGMKKGELTAVLEKQAVDRLTQSELLNAIATGTIKEENAALILTMLAATAGAEGEKGAIDRLNLSLKEYLALAVSNPMTWVSIALVVIPLLIKAYDALTVSAEESAEAMRDAESNFQSATQEVNSLNSELETTRSRIAELEEMSANGRLTPDQSAELADLRDTNAELERKIALNETLAEQYASEAENNAMETYRKNRYLVVTGEPDPFEPHSNEAYLRGVDALNAYNDEIKRLKKQQELLDKEYSNGSIDAKEYQNRLDNLNRSLSSVKSSAAAVASEQEEVSDNIRSTSGEAYELKKAIDKALVVYSYTSKSVSEKIGGLTGLREFADDVERVKELAASGDLTEGVLLANSEFSDFISLANQIELPISDLVNYFNATGSAMGDNEVKLKKLTDALDEYGDEVERIYARGGTVDLLNRPVVEVTNANLGKVRGLGMTDAEVGSRMTVASQTFQSGETAIVVTPILPNGEILSQNELDKYMKSIIASGKKKGNYADFDTKGLLLGVFGDKATFTENNKMAEDFAVRLHEIHEAMLDVDDDDGMNALVAELRELTEYDPSIKAMAERFSALEENIGKLSTGMKEFADDGAITTKTLADIGSVFGDFDSFENFAKTLTDSSSTMEQVRQAADDLASEYIASTTILDMLRDGNEELVKSMLKNIGVTNADELVESRLTAIRLEDKLAAMGLANATWEVAKSKLQEAGATETAIETLSAYRQKQVEAQIAATNFATANAGTIASLIQIANAAGIAGKRMEILAQMQTVEATATDTDKASGRYGAYMAEAKRRLLEGLDDEITVKLPEINVSLPDIKSGSSKNAKETDKYIAEIERFRKAIKRLSDTQEQAARLEAQLDREDDLRKQITIQRQLIDVYADEQSALHDLNEERRTAIAEGIDKLTNLGFAVNYDPNTNDLFIENLEHINELATNDLTKYETMADMSVNIIGKYSNATEATAGLIKDTEGIINNITEFNDANKDASESWWELKDSIHAAKQAIIDDLKQIAENAHSAVDDIQDVYNTLHNAADEYAANDGYLTVDTYQSILDLGAQYMQYLRDENGLLVINEENIRKVIAARTEQMALEEALTYVERLRLALESDSIEDLNNLLFATKDATDATWGLVYANLALLDLTDDQYDAALHNINAIRSLADAAIKSIGMEEGAFTNALNNMKSGLDDILKYTMDMLKQRIDDQIDALNEQKESYGDIVDRQKEMLRNTKKQADYQKSVASKLKEMAKIQNEINALSLAAESGDRSAAAKRAKLQEDLAELSEDLADEQNEHAITAAEEALDKQQKAFESEKDQEIKTLQESVSSYQKLYDMAINYIKNHWNTLYDELIDWNNEYGSVLKSDITSAWDECLKAAQRYGSYVNAIKGVESDINTVESSGSNTTVGRTSYDSSAADQKSVKRIVQTMKDISSQYSNSNTKAANERLHNDADSEAAKLKEHGVYVDFDSATGTWIITRDDLNPSNVGKLLYQKYHSGTAGVGGVSTPKQDEVFAVLQKGETVLTEKMVNTMSRYLEAFKKMRDSFGVDVFGTVRFSESDFARLQAAQPVNNVTNNSTPSVSFGDTYIYGGNAETVRRHEEISRRQANEVLKYIHVKR